MKKMLIYGLSAALLLLSLTACTVSEGGAESQTPSKPGTATENTPEPAPESTPEPKAYEVTYTSAKAYTNSIGTTWVQVIAEIENTGTADLYLSAGSYDLEDANGKLIASSSMTSTYPQVISPGEKAYMYEETTLDNAVDGELTVLPRPDVKKAKVENIRFNVTDVEISDQTYGGLKAIGRIENTSSETADGMTYVVFILKDANGTPIGQVFTIIMEDLAPGDKIGFEATALSLPDNVTADTVASYDVLAYPMQMQF